MEVEEEAVLVQFHFHFEQEIQDDKSCTGKVYENIINKELHINSSINSD